MRSVWFEPDGKSRRAFSGLSLLYLPGICVIFSVSQRSVVDFSQRNNSDNQETSELSHSRLFRFSKSSFFFFFYHFFLYLRQLLQDPNSGPQNGNLEKILAYHEPSWAGVLQAKLEGLCLTELWNFSSERKNDSNS